MRGGAWGVVLGLILVAPSAWAQASLLDGRVVADGGAPLADAVAYLHASGRGAVTDAQGRFALEAPGRADVLVVEHAGFAPALRYMPGPGAGASGPRVVAMVPADDAPVHTEQFTEQGVLPVGVRPANRGPVPPEDAPLRFPFPVEPGALGGVAEVTWSDAGASLRVDVVHRESGERLGYSWSKTAPVTMEFPSAWLHARPGAFELEVRLFDGASTGLAVQAQIAVRYGPLALKAVEGLPPLTPDAVGDQAGVRLTHPDMDLVGVGITNETADSFEVLVELAQLENAQPQAPGVAIWAAFWDYAGARFFAAFVQDDGTSGPASGATGEGPEEAFLLGVCDPTTGLCERKHLVPGWLERGSPGAVHIVVPKRLAGAPGDGNALENLAGVTLQAQHGFPSAEAAMRAGATDVTDAAGAPYGLGVDEYWLGAGTLDAVRLAALAPATVVGGGGDATSSGVLVVGLAALAGGAGLAAWGATRGRAPAAAERYERIRLLGEGSTGRTWLARHRALGKVVALKEVRPGLHSAEQVQRLLREARIAGALRHPHVVEVYDVEERPDGTVAVAMEYVDGGSLQALLDREGKLPQEQALGIWLGALRGLAAIHEAGVVHRDVKPSNILLGADGTAKLADFGVARSAGEATLGGGAASPVGTPLYMAPEQLRGLEPTPASDLYAASAVAYRMLAGKPHFAAAGGSPWDVLLAYRDGKARIEPLTDAPRWLNRLLARGLAPDPAARPRDAGTMAAEVAAPGGDEAGSAGGRAHPGGPGRGARAADRRPRRPVA